MPPDEKVGGFETRRPAICRAPMRASPPGADDGRRPVDLVARPTPEARTPRRSAEQAMTTARAPGASRRSSFWFRGGTRAYRAGLERRQSRLKSAQDASEWVVSNSATGTRTRVARVRAEYPNQLDYSGVGSRSWFRVLPREIQVALQGPGSDLAWGGEWRQPVNLRGNLTIFCIFAGHDFARRLKSYEFVCRNDIE